MIHVLVEPSSPDLQAEIADLLRDHPEFRLIENTKNSENSAGETSGGEGGDGSEDQPHPDVIIVADGSESAFDSVGWSAAGVPIILLTDDSLGTRTIGDRTRSIGARRLSRYRSRCLAAKRHPRRIDRRHRSCCRGPVRLSSGRCRSASGVAPPRNRSRRRRRSQPRFRIVPPLNDQLVEPLTRREIEVLQLLAAGLGNKEIASRLHISEHTAKFHVASIMSKLGAATRTEAVTLGIRRGLVMI